MTLVQMPEVVLTHIMENLDFRSLLTLRKVCRDIRNFIDDVIPQSSISEIHVRIHTTHISLRILDPQLTSIDKSIEIKYRGHLKGCSIHKTSGVEKRKKLVGTGDFVNFFWQDFEQILKHQKSSLEVFSLVLEHYEYRMKEQNNQISAQFLLPIMEKFKELLSSRIVPLKVKTIDFDISRLKVKHLNLLVLFQEEVMSILPLVEAGKLENLIILDLRGSRKSNFNPWEIEKTEQWRSSKTSGVFEYVDYARHETELYFGRTHGREICGRTILACNEKFRDSPIMQHFEVHYEVLTGRGLLSEQLSTLTGMMPFIDATDGVTRMRWFSKFKKLNDILALCILNDGRKVVLFESLKLEHVPVGARML